ncbi:MAG: endonuclease/exonuclease/phosphatase family protein [Spirochaetales bacterium]|nr:endonuclease/exonuclease/phosphatase family protein [Spirochaetales bacterium]
MHAHEKPKFAYTVRLDYELDKIRKWKEKDDRKIPQKTDRNIIIASWNLTNFGVQKRKDEHLVIMAEILRSFDVVAVQEVAENLEDLEKLRAALGDTWEAIFTDPGGNNERLAYLLDRGRLGLTGLNGELDMRVHEERKVVIEDIEETFTGFNRSPYMIGLLAGDFEFNLVNVHLYWSSFGLRQLETKALSEWAKKRKNKDYPPNDDIILIGDFNLPYITDDDEIYKILKKNGLHLPKHNTNLVGTNLSGENDYDEIAFFSGNTNRDFTGNMGVFDFDNAVFDDLWDKSDREQQKRFFQYIRYYVSDHRPIWAEFKR